MGQSVSSGDMPGGLHITDVTTSCNLGTAAAGAGTMLTHLRSNSQLLANQVPPSPRLQAAGLRDC
jgi:hypothetical protein